MEYNLIIIQIVMTVAIAVVSRYLIPWLKARMSHEQLALTERILDGLVQAAEQIVPVKDAGNLKFTTVLDWARGRGLNVNLADIEAAVYRLNEAKGERDISVDSSEGESGNETEVEDDMEDETSDDA